MLYDAKQMEKHLTKITSRWDELNDTALFEIRCLKENNQPQTKKFTPNEIGKAVEFATLYNKREYNCYTTINPIQKYANGVSAKDKDIIAAFYCFADGDTEEAGKSIKNFKECQYNFAVTTGKSPYFRPHIYYELDEPCFDLDKWTTLQRGIAKTLDTDIVVCNPSRIMRLGGSVNYPTEKKKQIGRVTELSTIKTSYKDVRPKFKISTLENIFNKDVQVFEFKVDIPEYHSNSLDEQNTLSNIMSGVNWHDNMIKIVASYVAKGRSDQEIFLLLRGITQPGYSQNETDKEVQKAIDGARQKGFTAIDKPQLPVKKPSTKATFFSEWDAFNPLHLPKRQFLYSNHYIKKYCSLTVSPGGLGKSTLVLTEAIAICTGRNLLGDKPHESVNVFYFNSEDDLDEIQRRTFATCQHYGIDKAELDGKLYIESGRSRELLLAVGNDGIINEPDFEYLEQRCKENHIGLLILDPLQNMHTAMETNEVFRNLGKRLSQLADDCNMSVEIIHHTRKISANSEATVENSRGGISLVAAVRSARLLNTMSRTESENIGLETNIDHFKIEPAGKNNLTRSLEKALWYQRSAVQLENGDWVAIVKKYNIPSAFDNISNSRIRDLYYSIKDTKINLMRSPLATRTEHKMSIHEFIGDFLQMDLEAVQTKSITKRIVKTWLDSKTLKEKTVDINTIDPNNYKKISTKIIVAGDVIPAVEI